MSKSTYGIEVLGMQPRAVEGEAPADLPLALQIVPTQIPRIRGGTDWTPGLIEVADNYARALLRLAAPEAKVYVQTGEDALSGPRTYAVSPAPGVVGFGQTWRELD